MRLVNVSSYFETHPGGLEAVAGALARRLVGHGWEGVWMATDATSPPADVAGLRHRSLPAWNGAEAHLRIPYPLLRPAGLVALVREIRDCDAVLVHDGLYTTSITALLAARIFRKPSLLVQHISIVPYRHWLLRTIMKLAVACVTRPMVAGADEVVFISDRVQSFFTRQRRGRPSRLLLNGVDPAVFFPARSDGERARLRAALGLPATARVALFVGRFVEKKGLHLVHQAARDRPDVTWLMAGWGAIDPQAWGLPNVQVHRGLSGERLADLYRAADVFVLPSCGEGFPLVIQEAMATGLPVVCGPDPAEADPAAAVHLRTIDVAHADAACSLAAAIQEGLSEGAEERRARAEYARNRYSWDAATASYASILDRLATKARLPASERRGASAPEPLAATASMQGVC